MPIDKSKITKEMVAKALECETVDELMALANWPSWMTVNLTRKLLIKWQEEEPVIQLTNGVLKVFCRRFPGCCSGRCKVH